MDHATTLRKLKSYYYLTKPGLIYGNLLTVAGGYLYGAIMRPELQTFLAVIIGSALVMACGTVLNNIQDRYMDQHMKRTKMRALVTGEINPKQASIYATILALSGLTILVIFTNWLTVVVGLIGLVCYAGVYTYAKPRTVHGTLIGTLPGATPPLAGYIAATNRIDISFWIIFAIMVCWQMTHFYAIATYRMNEYRAANVPVMTVVKGMYITKILMIIFGCGYLLSIVALAHLGYAGMFYLAVMVPLALWWLTIIASGLWANEDELWAKKVFIVSLILLPSFCITLALNAWLP